MSKISNLRSLAHLEEQLGADRLAVLIDPSNTGKIREFCDQLLKDAQPIEMTIAGRTYEILSFLHEDEKLVHYSMMVERANEMQAHLGKEEGQHLLDHHEEIPAALRDKVVFLFPGWRAPGDPEYVAGIVYDGDHWTLLWYWLVDGFGDDARLLHRK